MPTPSPTPQAPTPPAPPTIPAPPADLVPPPPGTPALPGVPADGQGFVVNVQELAVPRTEAEVAALRSRGSELSRQLNSAQGRRDEIARDLRRADGADRAGLEQRLQQLDARILTIETDIAANGRLLAAAPPALLSSSTAEPRGRDDGGLGPGQKTGISIVFTLFVLAPIAFAYARGIWRRGSRPVGATPAQLTESTQRLERMEQAVDAIAIEMERVSESQRFLTRILTEQPREALGAGPRAEPLPVARDAR